MRAIISWRALLQRSWVRRAGCLPETRSSPSSPRPGTHFLAKTGPMKRDWTPESWKQKPAKHMPDYPDAAALEGVLKTLRTRPPLVSAGEARALKIRLGEVAAGRAFLLQGGDCAESFEEFTTENVMST